MLGRHPGNNDSFRHIASYNRIGADDRIRADSDGTKHSTPDPKRDIIPNPGLSSTFGVFFLKVAAKRYILSHVAIAADPGSETDDKPPDVPDKKAGTDLG